MLVSDVILNVREVLQDMDSESYRYTDDRLIRGFNLGVLDLRRTRPDYFIGRYEQPTFQAAAMTDVIPLADEVTSSLVKYVSGWVELADDEYTQDGRAAAMLGAFSTDLGLRK